MVNERKDEIGKWQMHPWLLLLLLLEVILLVLRVRLSSEGGAGLGPFFLFVESEGEQGE